MSDQKLQNIDHHKIKKFLEPLDNGFGRDASPEASGESAIFDIFLNKKALNIRSRLSVVGVAGFEPAASCSQSRRDNRATLHPDGHLYNKHQVLIVIAAANIRITFNPPIANMI